MGYLRGFVKWILAAGLQRKNVGEPLCGLPY